MCGAGETGSIPGLERCCGEGSGNPLQYSCLENPHGQRNLVGYTVHRVTKSWTRLKQLSNLATYAGHIFKTLLGPAQVPSVCMYSDAVPSVEGSESPQRGQQTSALSPSLLSCSKLDVLSLPAPPNHHICKQSTVCLVYDRTAFVKHTSNSHNKLMLIILHPSISLLLLILLI